MKIQLRPMGRGDCKTIAEWRLQHNEYLRQPYLHLEPTRVFDNAGTVREIMYHNQIQWFEQYRGAFEHNPKNIFFVAEDKETSILHGVVGLTSIDYVSRIAEIHFYSGDGYIDNVDVEQNGVAKQMLDIIIPYAFSVLGLHSVFVETFDNDEAKFELCKNYGFEHCGTHKHKLYKVAKDWARFVDCRIQVLIND